MNLASIQLLPSRWLLSPDHPYEDHVAHRPTENGLRQVAANSGFGTAAALPQAANGARTERLRTGTEPDGEKSPATRPEPTAEAKPAAAKPADPKPAPAPAPAPAPKPAAAPAAGSGTPPGKGRKPSDSEAKECTYVEVRTHVGS